MEQRRIVASIALALLCVFAGFMARSPDQTAYYENASPGIKPPIGTTLLSGDYKNDHPDQSQQCPPRSDAPFKWPKWMHDSGWWQFFASVVGIFFIARQVFLTKRSVEAAEIAAKAAEIAANSAVATDVPTLAIAKFESEMVLFSVESIGSDEIIRHPRVDIVIKNHGKTPAFLHSWCLIFTCEKLPEKPIYKGKGCGMVLEKEVVEGGKTFQLPDHISIRHEFSEADAKAILERRKELRAYGYVLYQDLFGNPGRQLKFCELALNVWPGGISWVSDWNYPAYRGNAYLPWAKKENKDKKPN
jgi:hypothetical protein